MAWAVTKRTAFYLLVIFIVVESVFPFYYAILTSFKSGTALFEVNYWPTMFSWDNYAAVFQNGSFPRNLLNSVIVATLTVALALLFAVTSSYALSRVRFLGRSLLLLTILSVSMFPQIAVLSGLFEVIRVFGLFNTLWGLIFSYTIFTLPFTVWVLTTFMRELPLEIEEAAIVDGCSLFGAFIKMAIPLSVPAILTVVIFTFTLTLQEFVYALTFVSAADQKPITLGVTTDLVRGDVFFWGEIMAGALIASIPVAIAYNLFLDRFIAGITGGAVK